jgi:hypothetical protein
MDAVGMNVPMIGISIFLKGSEKSVGNTQWEIIDFDSTKSWSEFYRTLISHHNLNEKASLAGITNYRTDVKCLVPSQKKWINITNQHGWEYCRKHLEIGMCELHGESIFV